jgi:hypothetical protein
MSAVCRRLSFFDDYRVKIGEFGGSVHEVHGFEETVSEEIQYELPRRGRDCNQRSVIKRELFALGSAIYEIMAWEKTIPGLDR